MKISVVLGVLVAALAAAESKSYYPSYKPEYPSYKSEYPSYKSEYPSYKPEYPSYKPEYPSYKPDYPSYKPEYPSYKKSAYPSYDYPPTPYAFEWSVKDEYYNDYAHEEVADDKGYVTGSYRTYLPDGRTQLVSYKADDYSGYVADVKYEGEAKYSDYKPAYPKYPEYKSYSSYEPSYPKKDYYEPKYPSYKSDYPSYPSYPKYSPKY